MIFIKIHIVQQGDTLSTIMKQYGITKQSIEEANPHIANVALLPSGMKIKITSEAKVLHYPSSIPIERTKSSEGKMIKDDESYIRRAHVHERPFNKNITYDQKWNAYQFEIVSASNFIAYDLKKSCHHCHQPHYYITY